MSDDKKVIFSMSGVTKTHQGAQTPVIKNIYLSFFYGAKIGILGLNGSGKSTLLKIIAGVDKNYQGDVVFAPGYTVGLLEQEPQLDDSKTVIDFQSTDFTQIVSLWIKEETVEERCCCFWSWRLAWTQTLVNFEQRLFFAIDFIDQQSVAQERSDRESIEENQIK